jgi:hypothetical protein
MLEVEMRGCALSCHLEGKEEKTMVSQQTRPPRPYEEIGSEMPPQPIEQHPTPTEHYERFMRLRLALTVALVIVSMAMMVGVVGILFTNPVYADLGLTGALIGIGIAGFVLVCINVVVDYVLFTFGRR